MYYNIHVKRAQKTDQIFHPVRSRADTARSKQNTDLIKYTDDIINESS